MFDKLDKIVKQEQEFTERLKQMNAKLEKLVEDKIESNRKLENQISDLERQINDLKFDSLRKQEYDTSNVCFFEETLTMDRNKLKGIGCSCPKCSTYLMNVAISDGSEQTVWLRDKLRQVFQI